MLEALIFDLDNTLIDRRAAHARRVRDLIRRRPEVFPDPEAAAAALIEKDRWGYRDRTEYSTWVVSTFPGLAPSAEAFWADYRTTIVGFVEPEPGVAEMLAGLRGRYALGLITNGSSDNQRGKLARAGLAAGVFGSVVVSGELDVWKPDARIFRHALEALGCRPGAAVYVGDNPEHDIVGAHHAGLKTCWVSLGRTWPAELPAPDWTVAHVTELPGLLPEVA